MPLDVEIPARSSAAVTNTTLLWFVKPLTRPGVSGRSFWRFIVLSYTEEALARSFFDQWRRTGGPSPKVSECVGYRRPLFLGGQDTVANWELSDLGVYWTLMGQLRRQAKGLPEGTPITGVVREQ